MPPGAARGARRARLRRDAPALLLWALLAIGAVLAGETYLVRQEQAQWQSLGARSMAAAEALEQRLLRTLEAVEGLHALAQARHDLLRGDNIAGAAALGGYLRDVAEQRKFGVLEISATDTAGRSLWSIPANVEEGPADMPDHLYHFGSGLRSLHVAPPEPTRLGVRLTRPLVDPDGTLAGAVTIAVDPRRFSEPADETEETEDAPARDALVLRLPDAALIAASGPAASRRWTDHGYPHPAVLAALREPSGYLRSEGASGEEAIIGFRRVGNAPLVVAELRDMSSASSALVQLRRWVRSAVVAGLAPALVGLLLWLQIREARRTRRALADAEAQRAATEDARAELEQLLAGAPAAIYAGVLEAGGRFRRRLISANVERVTGWQPEQFTSPGAPRTMMELEDKEQRRAFRAALERDGAASGEYRLPTPDGGWRWLREEARAVRPAPGGGVEVVGYLSDITAQRGLEAQALAAAKLATLGEMAAGMAHEMNQPLAVISLAAENGAAALQEEAADGIEEALETLELVSQQAMRCKEIVQHLRVFSRAEANAVIEPIALQRVVDGALLLTGGALRNAGVTLTLDLPAGLPHIMAGQVMAEQVLVNLLLNARDALLARPESLPRQVSLRALAAEGEVRVAVTDTGGGIPAGLLDRVFEPFFTTKSADKGTGLGLSICHGIMRSFGGRISVRNVAEGAEFLVVFRAAPAPAEARIGVPGRGGWWT